MLMVAPVCERHRREMTSEEQQLFGIDKLNVPRSSIPAVTHVDYSARVQTVHRETNPLYHDLISRFHALTGCPVLVHTSFNVRSGGSLLLRGLLVLGAIIVAILFAAELLLRVIDFSGPSRFELGEAFQFDPELGWVPVPNAAAQQTSGNRTISVRHNSLGLRE